MILAIYGASGLGTEFLDLAKKISENDKKWERIIFVDDNTEKDGTTLLDVEIFTLERATKLFGKNELEFVLGIGEPNVKDIIFKKLEDAEYKITNLFYPGSPIGSGSVLGKGIVIMDNSGVPPMAVFGNNVLLQGKTALGHGIVLGDNVVISSFVFVGGDTTIGRNTYIAPHACLRNGIKIGENAIIGMGSVVTKDIPDNAVAYGNPCKVARINESGRVFSK